MTFPPILRVKLTSEIIATNCLDGEYAGRCSTCPIARAARAALPSDWNIHPQVGSDLTFWLIHSDLKMTLAAKYRLPQEAIDFISLADTERRNFYRDRDDKVVVAMNLQPFEFDAELTAAQGEQAQ